MDGYIRIGTKVDTSGFDTQLSKISKSVDKKLSGLENTVKSTFSGIKKFIVALGIGALIASLFDMGDAVERVDILNNYANVMANLGISADEANKSIRVMSERLKGLPTTLNDAAQSVQRFASANGNLKASTEMVLSLNNAILAGGAPMQLQKTALEQISQAYTKGKADMMEWRAMLAAMPAQLKQVAMYMGYASSDQLHEALQNGTVSMNEFMVAITKLNKKGLEGFGSFEEQARRSTNGIQTSFTNLKTALSRGLADIMNAIGQSNISGFIQGITKAIDKAIPYIVAFIRLIKTAVSYIAGLFGKSSKTVEDTAKKAYTNVEAVNNSISDTSSGLADATKKAKELNRQLAGFDEMNVLQEKKDSDSSSGGSMAGMAALGEIDLSAFDEATDDVENKAEQIFQRLYGKFSKLGEVLSRIWNSGPVQAYVKLVQTKMGFVQSFITQVGGNIYENFSQTWGEISRNVNLAIANISSFLEWFFIDIAWGIETWGQPIIDSINGLIDSIHAIIDPFIYFISSVWEAVTGTIAAVWDKYGRDIVDKIGQAVNSIIQLFQKLYDKIIGPIVKPMIQAMQELWDNHLKGLVDSIGDFIGKLIVFALDIYNNFIEPIVSWLVDFFAPTFEMIGKHVSKMFKDFVTFISERVKIFVDLFRGIIDFLTYVFKGDWEGAWNAIVETFENIVSGLWEIIKIPLNMIIDALNLFIRGLNKVKVPDWVPAVGGKGINIPEIQKLAKGGVINLPGRGVALGGEAGPEGVIPFTDAEQMAMIGEAIGRYVTINLTNVTELDGRTIARKVTEINENTNFLLNR